LRGLGWFTPFGRQNIAFINPDFDADDTKGGVRFRQTIVDISAQGVQGDFPLDFFLGASDFRSTQPPANHDANAFCIGAHGFLHCLLHGAAEGDALLQLFRDTAPDQVGIEFGLANLQDVETHALLGFLLKRGTQSIDLFATLANDDTRFGGMNNDRDLVCGGALDLDTRDSRVRQLFLDHLTQFEILREKILIITLSVPARLPAFYDAEPEPYGMHFMSQKCPPSS